MQIVFFTHPNFQAHQSMPRYAKWLAEGMKKRGHQVELWTAQPKFFNLPVPQAFKKWMGYLDQFFVFPRQVKKRSKQYADDTLFVFTDHALGPWVPLATHRRHLVHCHDFMAQKSALGQIPGQELSATGKKYQAFIRNGYSKGKNFISVSYRTQKDLQQFLPQPPQLSEVVYNGVNPLYKPVDYSTALAALNTKTGIDLSKGFLLHVGGNQWYKNRPGIVKMYNAWRKQYGGNLPLLLVGEKPSEELEAAKNSSPFKESIFFFSGLTDTEILYAYNTASVFLFPSLDEGFGWPIAEALACGCPVITTNAAPMTEVGGTAATYIAKMPTVEAELPAWETEAAVAIQQLVTMLMAEKEALKQQGIENARRFDSEEKLDSIEKIYYQVKVRMRLLHLISTLDPAAGGVSQAVLTMIKGLSENGVVSEAATTDSPDAPYLQKTAFKVNACGPSKTGWNYAAGLAVWLNSNLTQFDAFIIHGLWQYQTYAAYTAWAKIKGKKPKMLVMSHGMLDPYFQKAKGRRIKALRNEIFWKLIENKLVNNANSLLFTCETEKILAREPFKPYHPKAENVVGLGVEQPPAFQEKMKAAFAAKLQAPVSNYWLYISRIHEKKGTDLLVNAYLKLKKEVGSLPPLVIAGPGLDTPFGEQLKSMASADANIYFPGMLTGDAKWGAFYGCEIFVLPSHQENFGIAVVEALACTKPVLISNQVNIWREIESAGGGIVKDDTETGTYELLRSWYQLSPEQKSTLSQKALLCYQQFFTEEQATKSLKKVLTSN